MSRCACGLLLSGNRSIIVGNTAYYYQDIYTRLRVSVYIPAEGAAFVLPPYSVLYSVHQLVDPCHVCLTSFLDECSVFLGHVSGNKSITLYSSLKYYPTPEIDIPEILTFPKRSIGTHRKLHPCSSFHEHDLCGH